MARFWARRRAISCSGKTTASERICHAFAARGIRVKTISIDDFYLERHVLEERARQSGRPVDLDSPSTIYIEKLADCVETLRRGGVANLPRYSFMSGKYEGYTPFCGKDADIFLFEGIQAIYPNVRAIFSEEALFSVFIRPSSSLSVGGELFESHELRFARRLVRDYRYRNAPPEYTFSLWEGVRENERRHIEPFEGAADIAIDSTLAYEPAVIRSLFVSYLSLVPKDNPYRPKAEALIAEYEPLPSLPSRLIPADSIFREFIGHEGEED